MTDLALATTARGSVEGVAERVRAALTDQGFGVLTEIDMSRTLKDKIDADLEPYLILGACNPSLAHRAVTATRGIGLLLPCNVVVRQDPDDAELVHVEAMNPDLMVRFADGPSLADVAADATQRLQKAIDSLG